MRSTLRKVLGLSLAIVLASQSGAFADPAYYPTGPQTNIPQATLSDGSWTLCYSEDLGTPLVKSTISNACTGTYILYAGKVTSSSSLLLLAAGERTTVFSVTGNNVTNLNNGTYWYFNDSSLGFAPNATITQTSADTTDTNNPLRFSLHTSNIGGWRIGTVNGVNNGGNGVVNTAPTIWTKQVWTSNGGSSSFKSPLTTNQFPVSSLKSGLLNCSSGTYRMANSEVGIKSFIYKLYVNGNLSANVKFDVDSNIPSAILGVEGSIIPAAVSARDATFDVSKLTNFEAYCTVEAFGFGSSTSSMTNKVQDELLSSAIAAKVQAWEDQRAAATAANFTKEAREARKRAAARGGN